MNPQFPTVRQLLTNYAATLSARLREAQTIEEMDPLRLELQAVTHHLRNQN